MVTVASSIPLSVQGNQVLRDFYDMVLAWPGLAMELENATPDKVIPFVLHNPFLKKRSPQSSMPKMFGKPQIGILRTIYALGG